jgi:hypothetical protein
MVMQISSLLRPGRATFMVYFSASSSIFIAGAAIGEALLLRGTGAVR